jgi:hypothetical protein
MVSGVTPDDTAWAEFLLLTILGGGVVYATTVLTGRGPLAPPPDEPAPPRFTI